MVLPFQGQPVVIPVMGLLPGMSGLVNTGPSTSQVVRTPYYQPYEEQDQPSLFYICMVLSPTRRGQSGKLEHSALTRPTIQKSRRPKTIPGKFDEETITRKTESTYLNNPQEEDQQVQTGDKQTSMGEEKSVFNADG